MMTSICVPLLLAALLLGGACSSPETPQSAATSPAPKASAPLPATEEARAIIEGSSDFGEYEFTNAAVSIPLRGTMREDQRAIATALAKAQWVRFDGDTLALTDKARSDRRFLVRPNGTLDVVPLAKKQLVSVDDLRPMGEGQATATVTWRWIANDVGAAFRSGPLHDRYSEPQRATVTLFFDGAHWGVLRIAKS